MQAAPARYVSVSELYSTDEVELLLDEIRELEPTSCRGEDVQDFEIAGSGCGGRSPAGTAGTPGTERSWDSHAQYRRAPAAGARALAPLYCRLRVLRRGRGAASLALLAAAGAAAGCAWAGAGLRAATLPLAGRVQLLQLAALTTALLHAALLAAHVTGLSALMPIDWNKLGTCTSAWSALSLAAGGGLTLHALLLAPEYRLAPAALARPLAAAAALALIGACIACALVGAGCAGGAGGAGCGRCPRAARAYRAVPAAPPPAAAAAAAAAADDAPL